MPIIAIPKPTPIEKARKWFDWPAQKNRTPQSLAFAFAIAAKGYGLSESEVRAELMAGGRFAEGSTTVERAIKNAWGNVTGEYQKGKSWPEPDVAEVERIVAEYPGIGLPSLPASPNNRVSTYSQAQIIESLYYPKALVCWGESKAKAVVESLEILLQPKAGARDLTKLEFILPNPMRSRSAKNQQGKTSNRCKENASRPEDRRFTVIEFDFKKEHNGQPTVWAPVIERWESAGITPKDAMIRLLFHLLKAHHPKGLALVCDSAGKSIHAWVNARSIEPERLTMLERDSGRLGADWHAFLPWQFVRFPGGVRSDNGKRQAILFYNPDVLPGHEKSPES
jgi:hypothetical protein